MGNVSDLVHAADLLKDLPKKTDEMLEHLENIEVLLRDISEQIHKLGSE